jgi:hypothetical protein
MMRLALVVVATTVTYFCSTKPSDPFPSTTLTLRVGETRSAHGISVTFETVISDSRCPLDVVCVWAGDANARFVIRSPRLPDLVELWLRDPDRRIFAADGGGVVEFETLEPYPASSSSTNPAAYVATVEIRPR